MKKEDYLQPCDYHFSQDSILFAKYLGSKQFSCNLSILDIGCGCGVIGIELTRIINNVKNLHLVELQPEFEPYIRHNIDKFSRASQNNLFISDISEINLDRKFELIVLNPPYFEEGSGRLPGTKLKKRCHFISVDDFDKILIKALALQEENGFTYFLLPKNSKLLLNSSLKDFFRLEKTLPGEVCIIHLARNV